MDILEIGQITRTFIMPLHTLDLFLIQLEQREPIQNTLQLMIN